jgi:alkylation response protein AidB-like acyl-CoA dehydrogenase
MDFTLSPEQQGVQEKAQSLAREVKGLSAQLDREAQFPREILQLWAKEGRFGLALPREYGGQGLTYVAHVLSQMKLAQACAASPLILHLNHSLFGRGHLRKSPSPPPSNSKKEPSWPRRD